jgi:hypothetical protein
MASHIIHVHIIDWDDKVLIRNKMTARYAAIPNARWW